MKDSEADRRHKFILEHITELQRYILILVQQVKNLEALVDGKEDKKP